MNAPELIAHMAIATGAKKSDIDSRAVWLRRIGMLNKGGRGPNAVEMSQSDAVNLLLGISSCYVAKDVQMTVQEYRQLRCGDIQLGRFLDAEIINSNNQIESITIRKISSTSALYQAETTIIFEDERDPFFFSPNGKVLGSELIPYQEQAVINGSFFRKIGALL